jgi:hypothetical protein
MVSCCTVSLKGENALFVQISVAYGAACRAWAVLNRPSGWSNIKASRKRLPRRGDRGILTLALEVRNGKGEVLQDGTHLLMVRTRASGS